jgi:hypothetical protein
MWRVGMIAHKNHKEDHKNHKIVFGFASSLSICSVTFVFFFVVFVGKQASSFAQSIVAPNFFFSSQMLNRFRVGKINESIKITRNQGLDTFFRPLPY